MGEGASPKGGRGALVCVGLLRSRRAQTHCFALESSPDCERYGTRKYWAKMGPLVGGYDPMKACWTSEIEIHGRKMVPTYCEDKVCSVDPPFSLLLNTHFKLNL